MHDFHHTHTHDCTHTHTLIHVHMHTHTHTHTHTHWCIRMHTQTHTLHTHTYTLHTHRHTTNACITGDLLVGKRIDCLYEMCSRDHCLYDVCQKLFGHDVLTVCVMWSRTLLLGYDVFRNLLQVWCVSEIGWMYMCFNNCLCIHNVFQKLIVCLWCIPEIDCVCDVFQKLTVCLS